MLPRRVDHEAIELLHCPCYTIPTRLSCKAIVTVHDLIARTHPRLVGWRNAAHLRLRLRRGIERARVVCAPTEFVRRHIIESFNVNPKKVFVVPWGVDLELSPVPREQAAREVERRFNVREPFVLFCGCIEPKKNLQAAIEACNRIGAMLLIVGPTTSGSRSLLPQSDGSTAQRWRYLGYVSSADLSSLYSAAEALVFPSYTEGFGLPTIEAMSMGCPVITSDFPALREVCGGAAIHVPCLDANALAGAIRSVMTDRSLRENLVERGLEHSRQFTWRRAVDRFSEALSFAIN